MRSLGATMAALLPAMVGCSVALDFDPVGLPCASDADCPAPTSCGATGTCEEKTGGAPRDGGVDDTIPTGADVVSTTPITLTSPVGLGRSAGVWWSADLSTDAVHRVASAEVVCALPDTGVKGLAVVGTDVYTLHPSGLYVTRSAEGCATERAGAAPTASAFTASDGMLVSLNGATLERRTVTAGSVSAAPSWMLDPAPTSPRAVAVDGGLVFVASTTSNGSQFTTHLEIYDARGTTGVVRRAATIDVDVSASVITGLAVEGDRVWLITAGAGDDALALVEASFVFAR